MPSASFRLGGAVLEKCSTTSARLMATAGEEWRLWGRNKSEWLALLSLVELLHYCALIGRDLQLSYAIKNQLKAPKGPNLGHFLPLAGSLFRT